MITHENTLSERERYVLSALASDADPATANRARALLAWSHGQSREEISKSAGIRPTQVHSLTRAFSQKRLEVFSSASVERASRGRDGLITLEELLDQHPVRLGHARHVQAIALKLFDSSASVHQLGPEWRSLLEVGALLHNLGAADHEERHHRAGRDMILAHEIEGISSRDRDILACLVLFHTKKVRAAQDPIFAELDPETQHGTLALAAILRVADGLDFTQTQSTELTEFRIDSLVQAIVSGPHAEVDAARANKRADLWRDILTPPLSVRLPDGSLPSPHASKRPKQPVGIRSNDSIALAGRKVVAVQMARMRVLEDPVREGHEVEAVHDMRVATRRLRSAFRLFRGFYSAKSVKKIVSPLRELAGLLGTVRDLDVLLDNLRGYTATLPLEQQRAVDPLVADWRARRAESHRALVQFMHGGDYRSLIKALDRFIEGKERKYAPRVGDVAPWLIWKRYGRLREFEPRIPFADLPVLHRLRIQCKRLRYACEFFSEPMGPDAQALIEPLVALQDYLGELHDADMGAQLVTKFIAERALQAQQVGNQNANLEGATGYLSALQARVADHLTGFPVRWQVVLGPSYREALATRLASL